MAETYEMPGVRIIIKKKDRQIAMFVYEGDVWVDEYKNDVSDWWDDAKIIFDNQAGLSS